MAEAVGLAASIIALVHITGKVATLGYGYINGAIRAPKHLRELLDELNSLGKALEALQDYTEKNPASTAIQKLSDPLKKCASELEILKIKLEPRDGLKGVVHSLKWPLKEKEMIQQISLIERYKTLFVLALSVDQISLSKAIESSTDNICLAVQDLQQEMRAQSEALHKVEKRKKMLKWLGPEPFDKIHIETNKNRHRNTGEWLLKRTEFCEWIKGHPDYALLWGHGIPGAGKTFLSSFVISHLQFLAETENYGVAYTYFDFNEREQQKPVQVLANLIKQLLYRRPESPALSVLEGLYDRLKPQGENPTLDDLYLVLVTASGQFDRTFLVFDALDECQQENQRNELLPLFQRMAQGNHHFSLFLTSRPYPEDIQDSLRNAAKIELSAQEEDIKIYIREKIAKTPRARRLVKEGSYEDRIISDLVDCAKGMFLLVRLHIEHLCQQTTAKQILTALNKLKSFSSEEGPLDPFYKRAMDTLLGQSKSCVNLALKVLLWLVKARRTLTVKEIQVAVSIEPERYELDDSDLPDRTTLLDVCAGLVTIDENTNTIRLAHYTVQEYLINNHVIPEDAELRLAIVCTTYLSFNNFVIGACKSSDSLRCRLDMHPFLDYAASQLVSHLKACTESLTAKVVLRFLRHMGSISSYLQVSCCRKRHQEYFTRFDKFPRERPPLHIAASWGHLEATKSLLKKGTSISALDNSERTALHLAASGGHTKIVLLLLENGADLTSRDKNGVTALQRAVIWGKEEVVRLLIGKGATLSVRRTSGETPLHEAVIKGNETMTRLLLEEGADMSILDQRGMSVLHWASFQGDIKIIRLLIEKGGPEDLSLQDWGGRTALHCVACWEGEKGVQIVRLLLEKGVDYSIPDCDGLVPLHEAAEQGHEAVVKLLLDRGAEIAIKDNFGQTALYKAVLQGHKEVIQLLLQSYTATPAPNSYNTIPVHDAVLEGQERIRLLLEDSLDSFFEDENGRTALHEAVFWNREELARMLIDSGAAISIPDNDGQTPLHEAASEGHEVMARLLIEKGASVSAQDNFGQTPLHEAVCGGYDMIVRLLLENGADPSILDSYERAPSYYTVCPDILLLLEEKATGFLESSNGETHGTKKREGEKVLRVMRVQL